MSTHFRVLDQTLDGICVDRCLLAISSDTTDAILAHSHRILHDDQQLHPICRVALSDYRHVCAFFQFEGVLTLRPVTCIALTCAWSQLRIAINSALMILRKRRMRSEVSFDSPSETEEAISGFEFRDTGPSPEHICVHRQRYAPAVWSWTFLFPA